MSASSSTGKPSASQPKDATPAEKKSSSRSNADRLKDVEETMATLTVRLNRYGEYSRRQDTELTAVTDAVQKLDGRIEKLEHTLSNHLINDNQWWRQCICSIIEDIDALRKMKVNDRSPDHSS